MGHGARTLRARRSGARASPSRIGMLLAGLLAVLALAPPPLSAQVLEERELEFETALSDYQLAVDARNVEAFRQDAVLDSLATARNIGDQVLIDRLEGRARVVGLAFASRSARVSETSDRYEEARGALLQALDGRLDSLRIVVQTTDDPTTRRRTAILIADLNAQYGNVLAEDLEETIPLRPLLEPSLTVEPRDTPSSLLRKAQLLESRAATVQREIDEVDEDLERFRKAEELDRFTADVTSAIDRFGDRTVPVRSQAGDARAGQTAVADSTAMDLELLSPADAIVALERYRQQLVTILEQTLARATAFRSGRNGVRGDQEGLR